MPVEHIAFLKFNQEVPEETIRSLMSELERIGKTQVPGFIGIKSGSYDSPEGLNKGFNRAFIMVFENTDARNAYLSNPEHQQVAGKIIANLAGGLDGAVIFDFNAPLTPPPSPRTLAVAAAEATGKAIDSLSLSSGKAQECEATLSQVLAKLRDFMGKVTPPASATTEVKEQPKEYTPPSPQ